MLGADPMKQRLVLLARVALAGTLALLGAVTISVSPALAATGPDTIAPTKPATPTVSPIGLITATVNLGGSTDNVKVTGYVVQRQVNGVWADWSATFFESSLYAYVQPLTPGTTYTLVVVAFDAAGNRSPRSDPVTFTTPSLPAPTCRVVRQNLGPETSILDFFVENMTAAMVVTNWTTTFIMPAAQTPTLAFSSILTRNGDVATLRPLSNTAQINPGSTAFFGFYGGHPAGSTLPSAFTFASAASGAIACTVTDRIG
jgi:hypothetical protein